jgi:hypothetical protein
MLKIWSMVSSPLAVVSRLDTDACIQKKEQKDAENAEGQATGGKKKKVTAAQLRVQKGIVLCFLDPTVWR